MKLIVKGFLLFTFCGLCTAQETEPMGDDNDSENIQTGSLNTSTNNSTVSSGNVSSDNSVTKNYSGAGASGMPVGSAIAPSYMSTGPETCLSGSGTSIQTGLIGYTKGSYQKDDDCNRRKDSRLLSTLGMTVASIARMCDDIKVWRSLFISGTPCPLISSGKLIVGKRAFLLMKTRPSLYIPDYGEVQMRRTATWSKKPPTPRYTDTQKWYNSILNIGVENDTENTEDSDSDESVSAKFRSSIK
jgi:hypothetical protein